MAGGKNSVMTKFKAAIPHLFLFKCICHSFHLCASNACKKLPKGIEDLVRDIYNYIGNSPKRVETLKEFQKFTQTKIKKILHPSQTRWLSLHMVVSRIIEQYQPLKLFFVDAVANDGLATAENILTKLHDPLVYAILLFLDYILPLFNNFNAEMQSRDPKLYSLYDRVTELYKTLLHCFVKREVVFNKLIGEIDVRNPRNFKSLETVYLGAKVTDYIAANNLTKEQLHQLRICCLEFYIESCSEINKRFDFDNTVLKVTNLIDPNVIFAGKQESIVPLASLFPNLIESQDIQKVDSEWRQLSNSGTRFEYANNSLCSFWYNVGQDKYGDGTPVYRLLSKFAYSIMSLPHSSANVERIFSQVNLMKTKQRNCLSTNSIVGLLHSKDYIKDNCYNIKVDNNILSRHNSSMYKSLNTLSDSDSD